MSRWLLVLALAGCGEAVDEAAPPAPATKAAGKAAEATEATAEIVATEEYFYNPSGKRDPFQSFYARQAAQQELAPDAPPLQRYEVDKFTLHGVVKDGASPSALVVDPEGLGHVIRLGTYVGRNWGKVTSIAPRCVVVTEEYQDIEGNLIINPVNLCFPGSES